MKRCGTRLAALVAWGGSVVLGGAAWGQVCEFEKVREYRLGQVFWDARSIEQAGDLLYVTIGLPQELRIYDASDPESLRLLSQSSFAPSWDVAVSGSVAVLAGNESVATIDVSDPSNPRLLDRIQTPGEGLGVVIEGSTAYIADGRQGVSSVDLSDPGELRLLQTLETPGRALGIAVDDDVAYVADGDGGLLILDVRDPARMVEIRTLTSWSVYRAIPDGDLLGLLTASDGIVLTNVSDPASPRVVGVIEMAEDLTAIRFADSVAWVTTGGFWDAAAFIGFDLRDPSAPVEFGRAEFPAHVRGSYSVAFTLAGGYAHILLNQYDASYAPVEVELHTLDLGSCAVCYADCDGSGALDFFDFLCFQNLFAAGDPRADCDGSGELDVFDFLCFQSEFAAGCR